MPVFVMRHIVVLLVVFVAACSGTRPASAPLITPTETPTETPADTPAEAVAGTSSPYVAADADFMRNMIGHHGQAIEMASLVADRSADGTIGSLARRIDESQVYEIGLMRRWLEKRGESTDVPADMAGMAGMATPEKMAELADAESQAFDKLFLELMTRHHEGALVMVDALEAAEGGGQELELFTLISHIDADQRAEIARMQRMLNALQ
jgi:uncharacterized protein (DUF305 family)